MNTGPSSSRRYPDPLVLMSGSVAAYRMAPATRGTGVSGIPAKISLTGVGTMAVSNHVGVSVETA